MQKSANFEFNLPEESEAFDVNHMNENTEEIDRILKELEPIISEFQTRLGK